MNFDNQTNKKNTLEFDLLSFQKCTQTQIVK